MITTEHREGFLDLAGRKLGNIEIVHLVRRQPQLAWQCRCSRCASSWVSSHTLLVNGAVECPNRSCGRVANTPLPEDRAPMTRAFIQERRQQPAPAAPQPRFSPDADPRGIQGYLDSLEREKGRG
jgi:hypothetical protein